MIWCVDLAVGILYIRVLICPILLQIFLEEVDSIQLSSGVVVIPRIWVEVLALEVLTF